MSVKLVQKHPLKGTHEFELTDDAVEIRIKAPLQKEERLTVVLEILRPEPVVNGNMLDFHSRVKCGPLFSLFRDKPNPEEFNAFVKAVSEAAQRGFDAFAGINNGGISFTDQ